MKKSRPTPKAKMNSARRKRNRTLPWSQETLADVGRSYADPKELLKAAEAKSLTPAETKKLVGVHRPATLYPNHLMDGRHSDNPTIRIHWLDEETSIPKYKRKLGSLPGVDFPLGTDWRNLFKQPGFTVYITEGIKKAVAATLFDYPTVAIDGCFSHQSSDRGIELLSELAALSAYKPVFVLVVDSDYIENESVKMGWNSLAAKLKGRGCTVHLVVLPGEDDRKVGWDDFLLSYGAKEFEDLPRFKFDVRVVIELIRNGSGKVRQKHQNVAELVTNNLCGRGQLLKTAAMRLYFFDELEHQLFDIGTPDNILFRAYLLREFGINGIEVEFSFVHEHFRSAAINYGKVVQLAQFTKYVPELSAWYLNAGESRVIKVTEKGWEDCYNGIDGVIFTDFEIEPIVPAKRGSKTALNTILDIPNFKGSAFLSPREERMLYEIWIYFTLFPEYAKTRTHLLLVGPKGSFKTSSLRALLHLLFGRIWDVNFLNAKKEDAAIALFTNLPIVALDNLDGKIHWLDNLLATAATGGRIPLRILYETNSLISYPLTPYVCATSRDPQNFARDDVADRTLMLNVEHGDAFLPEGTIQRRVAQSRPKAWAKILENLPHILTALRNRGQQASAYRMADFANFALAVGPVLGYSAESVTQALDKAEQVKREIVLEHSQVHQALEYWITWSSKDPKKSSVGEWIQSGDLYQELKSAWPDLDFPFKRAQDLGGALANQKTELAQSFHMLVRRVGGGKRMYKISPTSTQDKRMKYQ